MSPVRRGRAAGFGRGLLAALLLPALLLPAARARADDAEARRNIEIFSWLDADHDGRITLAGARAMRTKAFDEIDQNHDGYIDRAEIAATVAAWAAADPAAWPPERRQHWIQGQTDALQGPRVSRSRYVSSFLEWWFVRADRNGDGVVTLEEMQAMPPPRSPAADRANHGRVPPGEFN
ncbi:EF-hand domain-containing protein [Pseudoxanthobacter sp.]|uniref:EF-hand domain-containing protein n=1 Tax=Pseudoxanthobacter sp. TaxID=1925742 RepID=UPI002FDF773F